ncbi:ATP phosphoribosyltransferase regulatory subunit [Hartmannibacter diazotrophicus]|uniref:ATP phosphoribosyltransferase regulatory subunit n=1 Tax=Hartmannibacter diazotrophicus TaxID=1482074 RepID=A0A2C9D2P7_9HYPH|nr:ATP phosphoribosyltransferase regulatory subunit [Hartmannibacter diazotrophicus]SON54607.1 ATP phosphoribosyltransferase regulatory subunit [Hartmannibacter diazotrophicus]
MQDGAVARTIARVSERFAGAGFAPVEVPVLLPMEDFVRISGEEFRRRMFVTTDGRGVERCLRPEFTIPVCRKAVATGIAGDAVRFSYSGQIFRNGRAGESDEVWQMGGELIGRHDPAGADAEILALALDIARDNGVSAPQVTIGDVGLFAALLDALALPAAWKRRLMTQFGDPRKVRETVRHMHAPASGFAQFSPHADVIKALSEFPSERVGELFADILSIAGIQSVGGRTTSEIAERVLEQATLAAETVMPAGATDIVDAFLDLELPLAEAADKLKSHALMAGADKGALAAAIARFEARIDAFQASGIALDNVTFSASFGRRLGYYDGFVFDITDPRAAGLGQVCGGGRYDALMTSFGAPADVKAVGFAVWTERLAGLEASS